MIGSTAIIWNQLQTISHCVNKTCSSLIYGKRKLFIPRTLSEKVVLIGLQTITIVSHEHSQARLLDNDLCQGVVKRYNITIPRLLKRHLMVKHFIFVCCWFFSHFHFSFFNHIKSLVKNCMFSPVLGTYSR